MKTLHFILNELVVVTYTLDLEYFMKYTGFVSEENAKQTLKAGAGMLGTMPSQQRKLVIDRILLSDNGISSIKVEKLS